MMFFFFFSSRRRHTRLQGDWSSDVCSSDLAGMAEAVKVALVRDPAFFVWLEAHGEALAVGDPACVESLVERSARLHLAHIAGSGDPFELGSARPLDFGHWAAHRLERLTTHRLRHGEAVAIGIA